MILSYLRTLILYLALIVAVRLMGKRQVGEMEPAEFVVTMLVANLAAIPMQDSGIPLFSGLVPIFTVLGAELVLSWCTLRSLRLRKLLCGKPVILIENGKILQERLRQTRVTLDELTARLRAKDILDLRQVQFAILETDGTMSVFPYPETKPASATDAGVEVKPASLPLTLVADGRVLNENLRLSGHDRAWLREALNRHNAAIEDTFLFALAGGKTVFLPMEK